MASSVLLWLLTRPDQRKSLHPFYHYLFPLCCRAEGRQQCKHALHQVYMERGTEINQGEVVSIVMLGRHNVSNKVVPVKKSPLSENV